MSIGVRRLGRTVCFILTLSPLFTLSGLSTSRPVVVHVDLRHSFSELDPNTHRGRQFTNVRVNEQDLVCGDISTAATRHTRDGVFFNLNGSEDFRSSFLQWSDLRMSWTPESQMLRHIVQAKTAWLTDQCFLFKKVADPYWIFDVCIGRSVGQFHQNEPELLGSFSQQYNGLGFYDPYRDEVYANGTVVQHYVGGKDGRSSRLVLTCGTSNTRRVISVVEDPPLRYIIVLAAPAFCDWRPSRVESPSSDIFPALLLQSLQGWCANFTTGGWWTYEYCYPDSLIQFHLDSSGGGAETSKNVVLVGGLYKSSSLSLGSLLEGDGKGYQKRVQPPAPSRTFPVLRSPYIRPMEPGDEILWPSLPLEFTVFPGSLMGSEGSLHYGRSVLGTPLQSLLLDMQPGTSCGIVSGTPRYRKARVYFYCPSDFLRNPHPRITQLREIALCDYEVYIATALVCAHPNLLPQPVQLPETVICYPAQAPLAGAEPADSQQSRDNVYGDNTGSLLLDNRTETLNVDSSRHALGSLRRLILTNSPEYVPSYQTLKHYSSTPSVSEHEKEDFSVFGAESHHVSLESKPVGVFGTGYYTRRRTLSVSPRFFVGQVVRHRRLDVVGIVFGWDFTCRLPEKRRQEFIVLYAKEVVRTPHYLIRLFRHPSTPFQGTEYLYSPENVLEEFVVSDGDSDNPVLVEPSVEFFGPFNATRNAYALRGSAILPEVGPIVTLYPVTLEALYPDDAVLPFHFRPPSATQQGHFAEKLDSGAQDVGSSGSAISGGRTVAPEPSSTLAQLGLGLLDHSTVPVGFTTVEPQQSLLVSGFPVVASPLLSKVRDHPSETSQTTSTSASDRQHEKTASLASVDVLRDEL